MLGPILFLIHIHSLIKNRLVRKSTTHADDLAVVVANLIWILYLLLVVIWRVYVSGEGYMK